MTDKKQGGAVVSSLSDKRGQKNGLVAVVGQPSR